MEDKELIIKLLKSKGYVSLAPIQEKVIPLMNEDKNIIVEAPTGSGKTLAYVLPLIKRLKNDKSLKVIIIAPSKELGSQITSVIKGFTNKVLFLPDMVGVERQVTNLKKIKPEIVVGMPSRLLELIDYSKLKLNNLKYIIIDEGDKVLKRSNQRFVEGILKASYKTTPLAVFSATYRAVDLELINSYREDFNMVYSKDILGSTDHYYIMTSEMRKIDNLFKLLRAFDSKKAIAFLNSTSGVEGLLKKINKQSREIFILHTDMDIQKRKSVLEKFRKSKLALLITTDIFSRGLDVPDTDCVINYDIPRTGDIYIHRSGRTSRGYMNGVAVSLVREDEKRDFFLIRKMANVHTKQLSFNRAGKLDTIKGFKGNHKKFEE